MVTTEVYYIRRRHKFDLVSDHKPLQMLLKQRTNYPAHLQQTQ